MSLEEGVWIQSVGADGDIFPDSLRRDAVVRTQARDTRILFGFSNSFASTVQISRTGASVSGDLTVNGGGRLVLGGVDVSAAIAAANSAIDALESGSGSAVVLQKGAVLSNAIADSNVPAAKIAGVLPVSVGGTGSPAGTFPGGAIPFGASSGPERLSTLASGLAFDATTSTLAAKNAVVSGRLTVAGEDVSASLASSSAAIAAANSGLAAANSGLAAANSGLAAANVSIASANAAIASIRGGGLNAGAVLSNAIADSNVPAAKIAGVLPVSVGGTGSTAGTFPGGAIPFGASSGPERLSTLASGLAFDETTFTLAAKNAVVSGTLTVAGEDISASLASSGAAIAAANSGLAAANVAITAANSGLAAANVSIASANAAIASIRGGGLNAGAVLSNAIADSNVPAAKIAGVLPVSVGGTGSPAGTFPGGAIPFGASSGPERLSTLASGLAFDETTSTLAAENVTARSSLYGHVDLRTGTPGDVTYRLTVNANAERDIIMTRVDPDGTESVYINFRDVRRLLDNIGVV